MMVVVVVVVVGVVVVSSRPSKGTLFLVPDKQKHGKDLLRFLRRIERLYR